MDVTEVTEDRLTGRPIGEVFDLASRVARDLTFNELLAVAGLHVAAAQTNIASSERLAREAARCLALAHTALEDALTRYNGACYYLDGTWKRADPDRRQS